MYLNPKHQYIQINQHQDPQVTMEFITRTTMFFFIMGMLQIFLNVKYIMELKFNLILLFSIILIVDKIPIFHWAVF